VGYKPFQKLIRLQLKNNDLGDVFLEENVVLIDDVVIQEAVPYFVSEQKIT